MLVVPVSSSLILCVAVKFFGKKAKLQIKRGWATDSAMYVAFISHVQLLSSSWCLSVLKASGLGTLRCTA